jgi:CRP-like cAMP-binding protein
MYFLIEGRLNVLTPDSKKVATVLERGSYVGEMALINESERVCSVIADRFSLLYMLKKEDFNSIMNSNQEIARKIRHTSKIRTTQLEYLSESEAKEVSSKL